jgi:hypothetical protein
MDDTRYKAKDKLITARRGDKEGRNKLDQAKIKYNFKDFLSQYDILSDQCTYFVETLSKGEQECVICSNAIY